MNTKLLYIEDDEVDALALKRVIKKHYDVELNICKTFNELTQIDLDEFDAIICDSNLPDADYLKLTLFLGARKNVQFVSGSSMDGEPIWLKPISKENMETLCCFKQVVNLEYIESLSLGDDDFELEMMATALKILPERLAELKQSIGDFHDLKRATHRTKSSYRVCGIDPVLLDEIEQMQEFEFNDALKVEQLVKSITTTINKAVKELNRLIEKHKGQG